jgi:ATP-binding cassette, subfamily B, multidrug efflux pump
MAMFAVAIRLAFDGKVVTTAEDIAIAVRRDLFNKYQRLSLGFHDRQATGAALARLTSDAQALNRLLSSGVATAARALFALFAAAGFMLLLEWRLALIVVFSAAVLTWLLHRLQAGVRRAYQSARERNATTVAYLTENLVGMLTVQLNNREARQVARMVELLEHQMGAQVKVAHRTSMLNFLVSVATGVSLALVIVFGGWRVATGILSVGTLFALVQYVRGFFDNCMQLTGLAQTFQEALSGAERIFAVLDEPEEVEDLASPVPLSHVRGELELRDVWFTYARSVPSSLEDKRWVLKGVNLAVRPGESVGVVGITGSGKSTLVGLFSRLYDVQRGAVLVDGHDVRSYAQRELRRHFAVVPQDAFLFHGTIERNIRLGLDLSQEQVEGACRLVGIHQYIVSLPKGYQTEVGDRGARLSAGQKQLLGIARALARNPEAVLVLDEATAHVDEESETLLQEGMYRAMEGRTSLIIAHRLSTLMRCDRILVVSEGRIADQGPPAQLLDKGTDYEGLYLRRTTA